MFNKMHQLYLCVLSVFLYTNGCSALTCFNCPGIRHPQFCQHVQECVGGQVCGVERLEEKTGEIIYKSGCMSHQTCNTNTMEANRTHACFECCSSDLCNTYGCGEQGLSKTDGRVCYSCQGVFKPEECKTIAFCDQFEVCSIEEQYHFGELFYHSGCKEKHVCDTQLYNNPIIGRRDVSSKRSAGRLVCCDASLCNSNSHIIGAHTTFRPHFVASTIQSLQTTRSSVETDMCPDGFVCLNDGICEQSGATYKCTCMGGFFGDYCQYTGSKQTNFNLIYPSKYYKANLQCKLLVASKIPVNIKHQLFTLHGNTSVTLSKANYSLVIDPTVYMPSDGVGHHGVELFCNDSRANVYGFFQAPHGSEGYFAIPARFQSTKYIISSFTVSFDKSYIAISPLKSNTVLHIHLQTSQGPVKVNNVDYAANATVTMLLSVHDTFQLSHSKDLTGTVITASDPLVVVSGCICNYVSALDDCNPLMEMILPINQLDFVYVIPTIQSYPKSTVRLLAVNSTNVTITSHSGDEAKFLQARQYYDFIHGKVSYVRASDKISVIIYPHDTKQGDPFMMTIHGIHQYQTEYTFAVPSTFSSFISIAVKTNQLKGFFIDGQPLTLNNVYRVVSGSDDFETGSSNVTAGVHTVKHSGGVTFGLWVYGFKKYEGYGYPGGIAFKST